MKKSNDEKVQYFLDEIKIKNEGQFKILQKLRELVFKAYPKTIERIMYGGIMFSLSEDFGGIFLSKNHISLEFGKGFLLKDPKKLLEGTGKFRRHLKLLSIEDIKNKDVDFYIKQIG